MAEIPEDRSAISVDTQHVQRKLEGLPIARGAEECRSYSATDIVA